MRVRDIFLGKDWNDAIKPEKLRRVTGLCVSSGIGIGLVYAINLEFEDVRVGFEFSFIDVFKNGIFYSVIFGIIGLFSGAFFNLAFLGPVESTSYEYEADIRAQVSNAKTELNQVIKDLREGFTEKKLKTLIQEQISDQTLNELVAKTDRAVWDKYLDKRIEREVDALRDNLTEWLITARGSSRVNYLIAVLFAGGGILAAMTFFMPELNDTTLRFGEDGKPTLTRDILFVLVPRALLVIALELVAFHFFRLHQTAEASSRYVRDEINTVRFKTTAFYAALKTGTKKYQEEVFTTLMSVERQRILQSGETTLGLERERIGQAGLDKLAELIADKLDLSTIKQSEAVQKPKDMDFKKPEDGKG